MKTLQENANDLDRIFNLRPFDKDLFHQKACYFLKQLIGDLNMSVFEVRSNKAGPGVRGDITLHTPSFHVTFVASRYGLTNEVVMFRSCKGMRDFSGGTNQWTTIKKAGGADFQARLKALWSAAQGVAA